jgi:hypothetical protein
MEIKSDDFWKNIIYKNGKLDEAQVLKELSDFYYIMQQVPKVYEAVTNGRLSKLMYSADTVISQFEECTYSKSITQADIKDMLKSHTMEELKERLIDYFELPEGDK